MSPQALQVFPSGFKTGMRVSNKVSTFCANACAKGEGDDPQVFCGLSLNLGLSFTWWRESQDRAGWRAAIECLLQRT